MKRKFRFWALALALVFLAGSAFTTLGHKAKKFDTMYYWFTPGSTPEFIRANTIIDEESTTGFNDNPNSGTLQENGYLGKDINDAPVGNVQVSLYSHP